MCPGCRAIIIIKVFFLCVYLSLGIPKFWLTALKNTDLFADIIYVSWVEKGHENYYTCTVYFVVWGELYMHYIRDDYVYALCIQCVKLMVANDN